jgi:hypothetical protein
MAERYDLIIGATHFIHVEENGIKYLRTKRAEIPVSVKAADIESALNKGLDLAEEHYPTSGINWHQNARLAGTQSAAEEEELILSGKKPLNVNRLTRLQKNKLLRQDTESGRCDTIIQGGSDWRKQIK